MQRVHDFRTTLFFMLAEQSLSAVTSTISRICTNTCELRAKGQSCYSLSFPLGDHTERSGRHSTHSR